MIVQEFGIEFVSLYGHLAYTLECPMCGESFEKHAVYYPAEVTCPYCRARLISQHPFSMSPGLKKNLVYYKLKSPFKEKKVFQKR